MDVKVDGKNVFRQLDLMLHNGGSKPTNTPPGPNAQPPSPGAAPPKTKTPKITDVQWNHTKLKCGDLVKCSHQDVGLRRWHAGLACRAQERQQTGP